MGASWVDSCSPRGRVIEFRGRGQPSQFLLLKLHGLALLPAIPLWSILESGHGFPIKRKKSFCPVKIESLTGQPCNRDGRKGDKKKEALARERWRELLTVATSSQ